ncbi:hypothetical protein ACFFIX_11115 [Metabacillus herbersteinensis]|uniref:Alpha/beta hydrolase n=1 Tax=Metabacillus herbersteinensis TaxID=283816 RepID=A0ABV6GE90_9BACI
MKISERFFQLENEWNVVHLPIRPNGFGIYILGDRSHFVDDETSFWLQHLGRNQLLNTLRNEGYTIFHSNLFGRNWGSSHAVTLSKQLYHLVLKREILNEKVHILAEGMGGLTALQLMETMTDKIRSVAMLNPCLDLQAHLNQEKENKFFYKRLLKELSFAYEAEEKQIKEMSFPKPEDFNSNLPVRIWQRMNSTTFDHSFHSKKYEELRNKDQNQNPIDLIYHLADNPYRINQSIVKFFKEHEKKL